MWRVIRWFTLFWLMFLSYEDVKYRAITIKSIILEILVVGMLWWGAYMNRVAMNSEIREHVLGMSVGIVFVIISRVSKEQVGYGDSVVMMIVGTIIGVFDLIEMIFVASLFSVLYVLGNHLLCKLQHRTFVLRTIPFIPFLLIGYIGVSVWG